MNEKLTSAAYRIPGILICLLHFLTAMAQSQDPPPPGRRIEFRRFSPDPFIPRTPGTFHSVLVANPALAEYKGNTYLFFRGQDEGGHDQIGMWTTPTPEADGLHWKHQYPAPVIPVSTDPARPDNEHVLDPAVLVRHDTMFIYYTGKSGNASPEYSVCLAISTDGRNFVKSPSNPVIAKGIAPEVIHHDGSVYLFYQRLHPDGYWELFLAKGSNGIDFDTAHERKVFGPSGIHGSSDKFSIATIRIFREGDHFYMTYAACKTFTDYPESICLARSRDLLNWEKYRYNPIFERGKEGTWDEGALWYPTVRKIRGRYLMWYEGAGAGLGTQSEPARKASEEARNRNYGGYGSTSFSQLGAAVFDGGFELLFK